MGGIRQRLLKEPKVVFKKAPEREPFFENNDPGGANIGLLLRAAKQ